MTVFNTNSYFKCINQTESTIIDEAKNDLRFQYKQVNYDEFSNQ